MKNSAALLLIAGLALAGCDSDSTTPSAVVRTSQLPTDDVIYGLHHVMTTGGVRSGVLDSDTAVLRDAGARFELQGVRLGFFNESGTQTGTLTARTGEYTPNSGSFIARGNVVLITQGAEGTRRLETEELHYEVNTDQLWSEKPFVLKEGERVTRGNSFRSDSKFRTWSVTGATTTGGLPKSTGGSSSPSGISF